MTVGVMGTALISPLYGIYKETWGLRPSDVTLTYVVYMLGALFSLLALGRLPDKLNHLHLLVAAVLLSTIGTFLSMVANSLLLLVLARFLVGIAASIATTAGAAALRNQVSEEKKAEVPLILSVLLAAGFGIGPLLGGLIGQFANDPLVVAYWPSLACGPIAVLGLMLFVTERERSPALPSLHFGDFIPKLTLPEHGKRLSFLLLCGAPLMGFIAFGFYVSMAPLFVEVILHMTGPLVSGASITAILVLSLLVQLMVQRVRPQVTIPLGVVALALSNAAIMFNLEMNSTPIFVAGVGLTAFGHACVMLGSMQQLSQRATPQNLAGLTSTYLVIGYLGSVIGSLGLGWLADHVGVGAAVFMFGGIVIAICVLLTALNILYRETS